LLLGLIAYLSEDTCVYICDVYADVYEKSSPLFRLCETPVP